MKKAFGVLVVVLAMAYGARAEPAIDSFGRDGALAWSNVIPGHAYSVIRQTSLGGTQETVVASVIPSALVATASVPPVGSSGFLGVSDKGVYATSNNAVALARVSGDKGSDSNSRNGIGDAFFSVVVGEDDSTFLTLVPLSVSFTLNSPPNMDYDLFVYYNGTLFASSTAGTGQTDSVQLNWGDANFPDVDDTRTFLIEVRRFDGYSFSNWSLTVQGNPL